MADEEQRSDRARIDGPSDDDLARVNTLLGRIGGRNTVWGAGSVLEVWVAEVRLEAERQASRRLLAATWVLAAATIGLVLATVELIVVTLVG